MIWGWHKFSFKFKKEAQCHCISPIICKIIFSQIFSLYFFQVWGSICRTKSTKWEDNCWPLGLDGCLRTRCLSSNPWATKWRAVCWNSWRGADSICWDATGPGISDHILGNGQLLRSQQHSSEKMVTAASRSYSDWLAGKISWPKPHRKSVGLYDQRIGWLHSQYWTNYYKTLHVSLREYVWEKFL